MADRMKFEVASAKSYPGNGLRLLWRSSTACTIWAIRWARRRMFAATLKPDGTWMIVEPFAEDATEANHESGGAGVLFGFDDAVRAGFDVAGGRARRLGLRLVRDGLKGVVTEGGFTAVSAATQYSV